ncbi:hypothetical protein GNI_107160 [Gregarina niphandrodes]|uniref:Uncharacterized protein n=1 Tax=Gregarina niphandrodes TaxID=110365 RepID=A0A023B3T7_GRENI|nr:hypothetical protein GNI_107160 [Gregarina niphandrodes]EZG55934.1 hypothetical protein GNI_107160 [Gregarina niphandrodes]|eukprot:XP_011131408.1 hypothetical protein GNI_107160 [Gregarina niphandrodes]
MDWFLAGEVIGRKIFQGLSLALGGLVGAAKESCMSCAHNFEEPEFHNAPQPNATNGKGRLIGFYVPGDIPISYFDGNRLAAIKQ